MQILKKPLITAALLTQLDINIMEQIWLICGIGLLDLHRITLHKTR